MGCRSLCKRSQQSSVIQVLQFPCLFFFHLILFRCVVLGEKLKPKVDSSKNSLPSCFTPPRLAWPAAGRGLPPSANWQGPSPVASYFPLCVISPPAQGPDSGALVSDPPGACTVGPSRGGVQTVGAEARAWAQQREEPAAPVSGCVWQRWHELKVSFSRSNSTATWKLSKTKFKLHFSNLDAEFRIILP